jgi:hypothetical protein
MAAKKRAKKASSKKGTKLFKCEYKKTGGKAQKRAKKRPKTIGGKKVKNCKVIKKAAKKKAKHKSR